MTEPILGRESRIVAAGFELRADEAAPELVTLSGYASVTNHPYDVAGGIDAGGWVETIAQGAFKRTLGINDNRALLFHHDGAKVLATTRTGRLTMAEDAVGLRGDAPQNTNVGWVADLVRQVEDGTIDEMSIGFYARGSEWSKDYNERTITEVQLVEATVTWAGANGATVAAIERSRDAVAALRVPPKTLSRARIAAAAALADIKKYPTL